MNQDQKAQRYDWLLSEYKKIENQIAAVPKIALDETLKDVMNREYTLDNEKKVNFLKQQQSRIDEEVKRLF